MHTDTSAPRAVVDPAELQAKLAGGFLLTDVEVARLLGVAVQTVRNWRGKAEGPAFIKLGGRMIRYEPDAVRAFVAGGKRAA